MNRRNFITGTLAAVAGCFLPKHKLKLATGGLVKGPTAKWAYTDECSHRLYDRGCTFDCENRMFEVVDHEGIEFLVKKLKQPGERYQYTFPHRDEYLDRLGATYVNEGAWFPTWKRLYPHPERSGVILTEEDIKRFPIDPHTGYRVGPWVQYDPVMKKHVMESFPKPAVDRGYARITGISHTPMVLE